MTQFFDFFISMWTRLLDLLGIVTIDLYGYSVNLLSILFVFLVIGFVVAVFWKGARS